MQSNLGSIFANYHKKPAGNLKETRHKNPYEFLSDQINNTQHSEQPHNNTEHNNIIDLIYENSAVSNNATNQLNLSTELNSDNTITNDKNNYAIQRAESSIITPSSLTTPYPSETNKPYL